ncbi:MAG: GNAT family N-acetyltransferase [Rubritalea sp.]|uniref:GNAT family N-acetyltransferase n=1 Tax=Rubritalea sp. TaxID=2109375 RepID=UPI0032421E08
MDPFATDLRGLLHYVPQFLGKLFVVDVEWQDLSEASQAEIVMDLCALQSIGVRLVIVSTEQELESIIDWAVDHDFRSSVIADDSTITRINDVIERGQAALLKRESLLLAVDLIKISVSLGASKLIALTDFQPLEEKGKLLRFLRVKEIDDLSSKLRSKDQQLLAAAASACELGVDRVHLLDASVPGVLLDELFSNEGVGTMIYGGVYRQIRTLKEEDISELLGLIGRSVRRTHLVPRSYEQIAESLEDYAVMEVDGHVVGCVALYQYGDLGEIACLYVKQTHEGTGYGADLVRFMEARGKERGMRSVFALTNRAANFFTEQMGYSIFPVESLPIGRLKELHYSGRNSQAFIKHL